MPPRRCHFFDDDGQPRKRANGILGCSRDNCVFVHPSDADWKTAMKSNPPHPNMLARPDSGWDTRLSFSSSGTSFPGQSSLDRRASGSSLHERRPGESRRNVDDVDSSHRRDSSEQRRPRDRSPDEPDRRRTESAKGFSRTSEKTKEREPSRSRTPTRAMPPPPTSRSSSSTGESKAMPPSKELTREEKLAAWTRRIRLMSDAVNARTDHADMESKLENFKRMMRAQRYAYLSAPQKAEAEAKLAEAEAQVKAKKKTLDDILARLCETDFWPVVTPPVAYPQEGYGDIASSVIELKQKVKELHETMQTLSTRAPSAPPAHPEQRNEPLPPSKRRRLSESEQPSRDGSKTPSGTSRDISHKQVDEIRDRVVTLEGRLAELETEMLQYDHNLTLEVDDRIEVKLEQLSLGAPTATNEPHPSSGDQADPSKSTRWQALEDELNKAGGEVAELASELAIMIIQANNVEVEVARLKEENVQLRVQVQMLEQQQRQIMEALEKQKEEMTASKVIVKDEVDFPSPKLPGPQRLPPPLASINPGTRETGEAKVLEAARLEFFPYLEGVKAGAEEALHLREAEIMSKLEATMKTVERLSALMEHTNEGVPPAASMNGITHRFLPSVFNAGPSRR